MWIRWSQVSSCVRELRINSAFGPYAPAAPGRSALAVGDSADQARTAVDAIGESVEAAFDGLKETLADPALKHDVRDVAAGLSDALRITFAELSAQLGQGHRAPRAD